MNIQSYGDGAEKSNDRARKRIEQIENEISTTKSCSDIYKLNEFEYKAETETGNGGKKICGDAFFLIDYGIKISEKTEGAFNIFEYPVSRLWGFTTGKFRVPERVELEKTMELTDWKSVVLDEEKSTVTLKRGMACDLGAMGKGFAGDEVLKILKAGGIKSAVIDLGGNIQLLGGKILDDGSVTDWNVGIKNPWNGKPVAGLRFRDKAIVTSGGYERNFTDESGKRYCHIINPENECPVDNGIASVTVVCDSGLYGDCMSTSLFVMGKEKAGEYWKKSGDFEMIIVMEDKSLVYTEGLAECITVLYPFEKIEVIRESGKRL